jgi:hypothetical protein
MMACPACRRQVVPNRPPLESLGGPDSELLIWHLECQCGHRFHETRRKKLSSLPEYGPVDCNCP